MTNRQRVSSDLVEGLKFNVTKFLKALGAKKLLEVLGFKKSSKVSGA